jgi:Mu transposase, C-terminal/Phage integrase family
MTFLGRRSPTRNRGGYDSEKTATLTLTELERWLALSVSTYHGQVHRGIGQTPAKRWESGLEAHGTPTTVTNAAAFLIDFLPVVRRSITRTGFTIDHVQYFSDALKPWIANREKTGRFVIRRDPRDISRIWVLDPDGATYLDVPYRRTAHPPVTMWEQRAAIASSRNAGRDEVDEDAIFRAIEQMHVRSVQAWLESARISDGPIFRPMDRFHRVQPARLSDKALALIVKRRAKAVGLDPKRYAGHSLRAGLATSAAAAGASERVIMSQTGHRSADIVRKYIRDGSLFRGEWTDLWKKGALL